MAIELTKEEEMQAAYIAGTIIGKGCIGIAKGLKVTGWLIGKGGAATALGLSLAATAVDKGSKAAQGYLYEKSDDIMGYGKEHTLEKHQKEESPLDDIDFDEKGIVTV